MINFAYPAIIDLRTFVKIILLAFLTVEWEFSTAQIEFNILPVSDKLLINPSFAGLNGNTSMYTGIQFFSFSKEEKNHNYFLTYDSYSNKLRGGYAFYFFQGLTGKTNINHTGTGITFSKPYLLSNAGKIISSLNINYIIITEQWFAYTIDKLTGKKYSVGFKEDNKFMKYNTFIPRLALLWDAPYLMAGLSSAIPLKNISLYENIHASQLANSFTFYFTKKIKGELKGLTSRQYLATPELAVLLSENTLIMFTGMRMELPKKTYGLFVQNNFTRHQYGLSALAGWKLNNLRINFSIGCSYSLPHNKPSFHGEMNLGFIIPPLQNEEGNPWSRLKNDIN